MFYTLIVTLSLFSLSQCNPFNCSDLNFYLTQKVDNEGFHRQLNWLLENNKPNSGCKAVLMVFMSPEVYVNPDEVSDMKTILIDGDVDVEMPSHLATGHNVYLFLELEKEKMSFTIPFHLRYQRAQISGSYGKVILNKPTILTPCIGNCKKKVRAPCSISNEEECIWSNTSYKALFDEVELLVPVGDLDHYPLVSIVTLLLGCAGCIYTLSVLSTTPL